MRKKITILTAALALFAMLAVPKGGWGQVVSGTTYNTTSSGSPEGWSYSGDFQGGNTPYKFLIQSTDYIQTSNFTQNGFSKVVVKARKYGGPSEAQAKITVSWYDASTSAETVLGTIDPTGTSLTNYTISSPTNPTGNTEGYIKIQCKGASSNKGSGVSQVAITYTEGSINPIITVIPTSLTVPNYVAGTPESGISYETFTVSGSNLTSNISLTLNENSNFQMSTDLETWSNTVSLTPTEGSLNEEEVAVRLNAGLALNEYSGSVTLSSTGAENVTINLSGSVVYAHVTYNGNGATSGNVPEDNNNYSYSGTVTVLGAGDLAKTGHTFDYWTTDAEGNDGPYAANDNYIITDNTTFYAQWSVNKHTVTLPEVDEFGIYEMNVNNPVAYGTEVTLQYEPEDDYEDYVAAWSINGEPITGNTFIMPDENVTVTVTCSPAPGTETNPYTVAEALENVPSSGNSGWVYVHGIVSNFYNNYTSITEDNSHRYYISDDGTTNNQLLVFNGKGLNQTPFTEEDDLRIGDVVTIYGQLYNYNGTKEINKDNYIVSLVREYRVTYDDNGATSGTVPTDETVYNDENNTVTVLGNTGTLVKDCNNWGGWNTEEDGSGDTYQAGQTFTITSNTTLYAVWTPRTHSYSLVQTGETQYIDLLEIYVPDQEEEGWQDGDPIQCGQQVAVSVVLTDEENYYCTITVVDENDNPVEVSSEMFTMPDSEVTITVEVFERPQFNITCNSSIGNGTISAPASAYLDATVTVTVTPATGYTLNTLTATYVDSNDDTQSLDFFGNTFVMPAADVTVSAMFSKCVEDVLNYGLIDEGHNYSNWGNKTSNSTAVYAGNSAGNYNSIQLRGSNSSGIITTASGGKAKKVVVSWESHTANNRVLQIYGKNTAYSSAEDLYNNNNKGTLLGYISYKSSSDYTTELIIPGDYEYIGIRSSSNALYLSEIRISWVHSYTEEVAGHGNDNTTGWQFIASPILEDVTVSVPAGDDADLYYYDEQDHIWRNYKKSGNESYFDFANGTGYLYANRADAQVTFAGASVVTGNTKSIELSYHETTSGNESNRLAGWNLVGNPFNCAATLDMDCYILSGTAINTTAQTAGSYTVGPCEGVMVKANEVGQLVTFTKATPGQTPQPNQLQMTVAQQVVTRNGASTGSATVEDNAIVSFNEGNRLEKFAFNADAAKLYIPQNDKEYAIVSAEAQGEMPVNFKAAENGTYTLSIAAENVEMNYLHLIDNMTGMDIDLLQTPSYTFEATTRDYESRFRLVFAANNNNEDGPSTGSGTFAFYSNGNWIINNAGEAILQVIDVTGRILSSETVNGSVSTTINATPGVYMLRLINGENVNVQKIVVR